MTVRIDAVTLALVAITVGGALKGGANFLLAWGAGVLLILTLEEIRRR